MSFPHTFARQRHMLPPCASLLALLCAVASPATGHAGEYEVDVGTTSILFKDAEKNGSTYTFQNELMVDGLLEVRGISGTLDAKAPTLSGTLQNADISPMNLGIPCQFKVPSGTMGLADGAFITSEVWGGDIGVGLNSDDTYFYTQFEGDGGTVECGFLSLPFTDSDTKGKFYISPEQGSFYTKVKQLGFNAKSGGSTLSKTLDISQATVAFAADRSLTWESVGSQPRMETVHFLLGGNAEVKVGKLRVGVRDALVGIRGLDNIDEIMLTGEIYIPGVEVPGIGKIEVPLGEGYVVYRQPMSTSPQIEVMADMTAEAWDGTNIPGFMKTAFDACCSQGGTQIRGDLRVSGDGLDGSLLATQQGAFGLPGTPFSMDATLGLAFKGTNLPELLVSGRAPMELGSLDFGEVYLEGRPDGAGFVATGTSKVRIPGTSGKDMSMDFRITETSMSAEGDIKLWGVKLKGGMGFNGFTLKETTLSNGFNLAGIAGAKLKLTIGTSSTKIKAEGNIAGASFGTSVDSKGCFKVSGVKYCI